jgi:predicted anti-sigma-YlaC factor YlaD
VDCKDVRSRLSPYIDGELTQADEAELKAHLTDCPNCLAELNGLRQAEALAAQALQEHPPAGYFDQFAQRATDKALAWREEDTEFSHDQLPPPKPPRWERHIPLERRPIVWVSAAAALLVAMIVAGYEFGVTRIGRLRSQPTMLSGVSVDATDEIVAGQPSQLNSVLAGSEVVLTRVVRGQPSELVNLAEQIQQADLLGQIAQERNRNDEPELDEHLQKLEIVMLRIVNTKPAAAPQQAVAIQQAISSTALLEANGVIMARTSNEGTAPGRQPR